MFLIFLPFLLTHPCTIISFFLFGCSLFILFTPSISPLRLSLCYLRAFSFPPPPPFTKKKSHWFLCYPRTGSRGVSVRDCVCVACLFIFSLTIRLFTLHPSTPSEDKKEKKERSPPLSLLLLPSGLLLSLLPPRLQRPGSFAR